jgi:lipoate-protein ligase A
MQKISLNVVRCRGLPIFKQLQAEEVLLRATKENWFLFNTDMMDLSIVLGFSGKVMDLVDVEKVRKSGEVGKKMNLIRRYTGGGTVIVDDSTVFTSFIMNANEVSSKPFPREIMQWSETIFKPVFEERSIVNRTTAAVFTLRENDYILDNLKIGGNAQSIVKDRWAHHTSFLWDYQAANMQFLLMPKKRPEYRNDRSHTQFLDRICNHISTRQELEHAMITQLRLSFDIKEYTQSEMEIVIENAIGDAHSKNKPVDVRTRLEDIYEYAPGCGGC